MTLNIHGRVTSSFT